MWYLFFFFKQKTAYEMRISDWSSDVCSSDLFDNGRVFTILMYYVRNGVDLDKAELLETLSILAERGNLGPFNLAAIGYLVMNDLDKPDLSLWYFTQSIEKTSANDPFP